MKRMLLALTVIAAAGRAQTPANGQSTPAVRSKRISPVEAEKVDKSPKVALLVGVGDYDPDLSGLAPLRYTVADVEGVGRILTHEGFSVRLLTDKAATSGEIRRSFKELTNAVTRGEGTFVFMFSGHGGRVGEENFLATFGITSRDLARQGMSLTEVKQLLHATGARQRIAFLDACRDEPNKGQSVLSPVRDTSASEGLRILYSTAPGRVSYEDEALQHGVFSSFLIGGLQGKAMNPGDGLITFNDLADFVTREMKSYGVNKRGGMVQIPYQLGESSGDFLIAKLNPLPPPAVATPEPPSVAPSSNQPLRPARLSITGVFQPSGAPSGQVILSVTPNAGNTTYTATMAGGVPVTFLNGVSPDHGQTFQFDSVQRGMNPMGNMVMLGGSLFAVSGGSMRLKLTPTTPPGRTTVSGSAEGTVSLDALPYTAALMQGGSPGGGVKLSGAITGTYTGMLVPDVPDSGASSSVEPPASLPANPLAAFPAFGAVGGELQPGEVRMNRRARQSFVWIPPGKFMMGCSPADTECVAFERPAHPVTITKGFWMEQAPVTVEEWNRQRLTLGGLPHLLMKDAQGRSLNNALNLPAVGVTWIDAQAFCKQGDGRLPTEAEWEYAARAGTETARYGELDAIAWYMENSGKQPLESRKVVGAPNFAQFLVANGNAPHAVRQKQPNKWNLYDMLGNVTQWAADWYNDNYYKQSPATDPKGPPGGTVRVARGGSWWTVAAAVRASARMNEPPDRAVNTAGFRCVVDDLQGSGTARGRR